MSDTATNSPAPPAQDISGLAEHLFRHEAGRLVSVLTSIFGMDRLQFAEDVVQESLIKALKTWPYYGVPKNPAAWLTQTAKNLALDLVRREKNFHDKQPQIIAFMEQWSADADDPDSHDHEIKDERLRLMFACCHPQIPADAQIALALKTLCGFSPEEIAKAFLTSEAAIAKRLVRARQRIRELEIQFEIPTGEAATVRLESVMQTLYLLFNEGYKASSGENLIREELCKEAIRLTTLLTAHPIGNQPRVHALAALMYLNAARLKARMDSEGNILLLRDQDRSLWDRTLVVHGIMHLSRSATGDDLSEYHLQAGIAACHGTAKDYQSTDWAQILSLYDRLVSFDDSPVIALNRAVAVANVHGPEAGIKALEAIRNQQPLNSYYLFYAVRADFEVQLSRFASAGDHLRKALELTEVKSEQSLLTKRLQECEQQRAAVTS
ncbi:MAG TPA: sigma-70 family RNA polymerase sigma factor [Verrucomicrobiae bacterium]